MSAPDVDALFRNEFITVEELADLCRVSPKTVRGWRSRGLGPTVTKLGGRVLFRRADVERWFELSSSTSAQIEAGGDA